MFLCVFILYSMESEKYNKLYKKNVHMFYLNVCIP